MLDRKFETIWQKILISNKFQSAIRKYRELFGIPLNGFKDNKEYRKWEILVKKKEQQSPTFKKQHENLWHSFFNEMERINSVSNNFKGLILCFDIYLLYGDIDYDMGDITGCHLIYEKQEIDLDKNVLISIGHDASIKDIKDFIERYKDLITDEQYSRRKKLGLSEPIKIRRASNIKRDQKIYLLSRLSKKELTELGGGNSNYKDIQIARIIKLEFDKDISNDNVRKIISRQKKIIEG